MLKITDAVKHIVFNNEILFEALRSNVLNLSACANQIQKEVEAATKKQVKQGTLVVALARLKNVMQLQQTVKPLISITKISIQTSLTELVFEKNEKTIHVVQKINAVLLPDHDFFAISEGTREIILIVPQETVKDIKNIFRNKMKAEYRNLVALSVRFSPDYVAQPNVLYALLGVLAIKRINLIEIVSTYTELTFILEQKDLEIAVQVFHKYIQE